MSIKVGINTVIDDSRNATFNNLTVSGTFSGGGDAESKPELIRTEIDGNEFTSGSSPPGPLGATWTFIFDSAILKGTGGNIVWRFGSASGTVVDTISILDSRATINTDAEANRLVVGPINLRARVPDVGDNVYITIEAGVVRNSALGTPSESITLYYNVPSTLSLGWGYAGGQYFCSDSRRRYVMGLGADSTVTTNWGDSNGDALEYQRDRNAAAAALTTQNYNFGALTYLNPSCGLVNNTINPCKQYITPSADPDQLYWTNSNVGNANNLAYGWRLGGNLSSQNINNCQAKVKLYACICCNCW